MRHDFLSNTVMIGYDFAFAQGPTMQWRLMDQSIARSQSQNGTRKDSDTLNDEIPMVSGKHLVFSNWTWEIDVVIDDE